jgi:hypothetical protein
MKDMIATELDTTGEVPAPSPQLARLLAAIEAFCNGPEAEQPAAELINLRHGCDLIELRFSKTAARFAATGEYEDWGSVSAGDWIRHNCRMASGAAWDRVCVGEQLEKLPASTEAMSEGRIGFAHLALMARTSETLQRSPTSKQFSEHKLLEEAETYSVARFRRSCDHARHAADPEGYADKELEAVEKRKLEISNPNEEGMVFLRGIFDSVGGAALRTALEPLARKQGADDDRRRDRRLADALVELSSHAMDSGRLPRRSSQRTHLQVTTTLETLLGLRGAPAADMEFSLPISARTLERLACDCSVTRILLGPDSAIIDVGRAKRVPSPSQHKALNARDGGCIWPGCDRPVSWTTPHHLIHWIYGGPTDLPNLCLLCYRHHLMIHEGRWQLIRTDDGRLLTVPPQTFLTTARAPDSRPVPAGRPPDPLFLQSG